MLSAANGLESIGVRSLLCGLACAVLLGGAGTGSLRGGGQQAWIDPAWRTAPPATAERPHHATIWFDAQYVDGTHTYAKRVEQYGAAARRDVRRAVVDTLRLLHDASWRRAREAVEALTRQGSLSACERHWVVNSITCAVRDEDLEQIASIPGASRIYFVGQSPAPSASPAPVTALPRDGDTDYVPDAVLTPRGHGLMGVDRVWRELGLSGRGVLHVIHDVGWTLTQPAIRQTLWRNPREIAGNGIDDDGNGYIDDVHGYHFDRNSPDIGAPGGAALPGGSTHGDLTAAVAAGRQLGDTAVIIGVAPNSRWAGVVNGFLIERSLEWAIELDAHTYSMSFSIPNQGEYRSHWRRAAEHAALAGLFLVSGAGNFADSTRQNYAPVPVQMRIPEDIPLAVLGVTGVGANGQRPAFASQGPVEWRTAEYGEGTVPKPDLATINANIIGFDGRGNRFVPSPEGWLGNSFAGPHLAGVIALLVEADAELTPWRAREILMRTARDLGAPGFDSQTGAGLVDAYAAALAVQAAARRRPDSRL